MQQRPSQSKILICGVGKNIASTLKNAIDSAELLGSKFADYSVIIYENNSNDNSSTILKNWEIKNPKVCALSERVANYDLPSTRVERIARARNIVLNMARDPKYHDFDYLLWADLDFKKPWPISAILETVESPLEWDCVFANGINSGNLYYDRYAFRDQKFPFGPEILGDSWWSELFRSWFHIGGHEWKPVFSAFGGLAIYKMESVINFSYSAIPTEDVRNFYHQILYSLPDTCEHVKKYQSLIGKVGAPRADLPIDFRTDKLAEGRNIPICCEHVSLHASMYVAGFKKFYINPQIVMHYN